MSKTKEDRRNEANERQAEHSKLTVKQKIEKLEARGVKSGREYTKLVSGLSDKP